MSEDWESEPRSHSLIHSRAEKWGKIILAEKDTSFSQRIVSEILRDAVENIGAVISSEIDKALVTGTPRSNFKKRQLRTKMRIGEETFKFLLWDLLDEDEQEREAQRFSCRLQDLVRIRDVLGDDTVSRYNKTTGTTGFIAPRCVVTGHFTSQHPEFGQIVLRPGDIVFALNHQYEQVWVYRADIQSTCCIEEIDLHGGVIAIDSDLLVVEEAMEFIYNPQKKTLKFKIPLMFFNQNGQCLEDLHVNNYILAKKKLAYDPVNPGDWVEESIVNGWRQQILADELLHQEVSDKHQVVLFNNPTLKRCLVIDGRMQVTADDSVYHEVIAHVPMMSHPSARQILLLGGSDGATARELLKYPRAHVTLVDIDPALIELSRRFLPEVHQGAFDNERLNVIFQDRMEFVREAKPIYDIIIIDAIDPREGKTDAPMYTRSFYHSCKVILRKGGILVIQNGHPQFETFPRVTITNLHGLFANVSLFCGIVPSYLGGMQTFAFASDDPATLDVSQSELEERWSKEEIDGIKYYTPQLHKAAFVLPRWLERLVQRAKADASNHTHTYFGKNRKK